MTPERRRVVLVAGGSGDIGSQICKDLLGSGAMVASAHLRPPSEPFDTSDFRSDVVDLTDAEAVRRWIDDVEAGHGPIGGAVIATGVVRPGRLVELSPEDWRRDLAVLLDSVFLVATGAVRAMLRAGGGADGRIVVIGSWAAEAPHPHIGAYSIAKAAVRALVKNLALTHAPDGILVNEVAPGIVPAGLSRRVFEEDPDLARRTLRGLPLGTMVEPAEVSREVLHLLSTDNRSVTGSVVTIDGAISLASPLTSDPEASAPTHPQGGNG